LKRICASSWTITKKDGVVYYHYVLNRLLVDSVPVIVTETGHFHNKSLYCHNTVRDPNLAP